MFEIRTEIRVGLYVRMKSPLTLSDLNLKFNFKILEETNRNTSTSLSKIL